MTYDAALWGAVACTLTALGGVLSYLAWQRRGLAAGVRGVAWSLLPLAAWLTGTLRLLAEVLGDVGRWAVHRVFSPIVWVGICLAGVAVVLFGVSGAMRRRGSGREAAPRGRGERPEARSSRRPRGAVAGSDPSHAGLDNGDEIEAILRKHGIR